MPVGAINRLDPTVSIPMPDRANHSKSMYGVCVCVCVCVCVG